MAKETDLQSIGWASIAQWGVISTGFLIFVSFSISFGELRLFDDRLIGAIDQNSMYTNFYSIADDYLMFLSGMIFNAPFLTDISKHRSTILEILQIFGRLEYFDLERMFYCLRCG